MDLPREEVGVGEFPQGVVEVGEFPLVEAGAEVLLPQEEGEVGEFPLVVVEVPEFHWEVEEVVVWEFPQEEGVAGEELPQLG